MTDNTRFRLLFGAKRDGSNNSQYQIKWIHTLYVKLKGGPAVEHGTGDDDGSEKPAQDQGNGDSPAAPGSGNGGADGFQGPSSTGGSDGSDPSATGSGTAGQVPDAASTTQGSTGGTYHVYQVMSRYHNKTETEVEYQNPFAPFALPLGVAVCLSGALESVLWFRRQTQVVSFVPA